MRVIFWNNFLDSKHSFDKTSLVFWRVRYLGFLYFICHWLIVWVWTIQWGSKKPKNSKYQKYLITRQIDFWYLNGSTIGFMDNFFVTALCRSITGTKIEPFKKLLGFCCFPITNLYCISSHPVFNSSGPAAKNYNLNTILVLLLWNFL
jgi:hypothetical protein